MATYSNLFVDQGSDFDFTLNLQTSIGSIDLSNYTARGQIKRNYASSQSVDFNILVNAPSDSLVISLTAAQTAAMKATRYVYDIQIVSNDSIPKIIRVLEGQLEVTPGVTTVAEEPLNSPSADSPAL